MIGLKLRKPWVLGLAGLAISLISVLAPAHPAQAVSGEYEGGRFVVVVGGSNIRVTDENTKLSISPSVSTARMAILDGRIVIGGVPAGRYEVTAEFKFTTDDCDSLTGWIVGIVAPPLKTFCDQTDVGKSYWTLKKTWNVTFEDDKRKLLEGANATAEERYMGTALETNADGSAKVNCDGKGVLMSFVICPMIESVLGVMEWTLRSFIQPYLAINPLTTTNSTGGESQLYGIWNNIRNFANIMFIAAFFVIVFSQATSVGISNYGIKRLLPRLVLIAIGTNISFFVCAFLVDVFNVLGAGAASLLMSTIIDGQPTLTLGVELFDKLLAFGPLGTMSSLLAQGVLSIGIIFGLFIFLIIGAAVVFVSAIIILLRQVALIFLIIVSPLAFVAGLLPNTQKSFTRWFTAFARLLAMYPVVMILFASGKIASSVLQEVGK